ncbi:hypothetical protein [Mesobacillus foraminis]|uniref:hypothetical protein n=1 Tax=Mesobacillus foraminis TaxID=279826 RepID=UPI001304BEBE|nr:hypothetical protein [Mesobacillus foraminis]
MWLGEIVSGCIGDGALEGSGSFSAVLAAIDAGFAGRWPKCEWHTAETRAVHQGVF